MGKSILTGILVGVLVFATGGFGGVLAGLGAVGSGILAGTLAAGLSAYQQAQRKRAIRSANALQTQEVVLPIASAPAMFGCGEVEVGGVLVHANQSSFRNWESVPGGQGFSKPCWINHQLIAIAKNKGGITSIEGVRLNDEYHPIAQFRNDHSTFASYLLSDSTANAYELVGGRDGYGSPIRADTSGSNEHPSFYPVMAEFGLGDEQVEGKFSDRPRDLIGAMPEVTEDFRGVDVAWAHMGYRLIDGFIKGRSERGGSEKLFQSGVPATKFRLRLAACYDPRVGSHDIDDPSTWAWTRNPAVFYAWYLMQIMKQPESKLMWDTLIAWANSCDGQVPDGKGGMEARWELDVVLGGLTDHESNMSLILDAGGGATPIFVGGKWGVTDFEWTEPVVTITQDDLLAPIEYNSNAPLQERFNAAAASHYSRDHAFSEVTTAPHRLVDLERRDGQEIVENFALPGVSRGSQAQRYCWRKLNLQRAQERMALVCKFGAFKLIVGSRLDVDSEYLFGGPKTFRVEQLSIAQSGREPVVMEVIEDDPDYWRDLPDAGYHDELPDGEIEIAEVVPPAPYDFTGEDGDGRITWRWTGSVPGATVRLWTTGEGGRFEDAVVVYEGDATEFVELLPNINDKTLRFGWIATVVNGVQGLRNPDDEVSSISAESSVFATGSVPETTHSGPLDPGKFPDEQLGTNRDIYIAYDKRQFLKNDPQRSPFDAGVLQGERSGVYWRALAQATFALPTNQRLALDDSIFKEGGLGYFGGDTSLDAATGAFKAQFFGTPDDDGLDIPSTADIRGTDLDTANGPVVLKASIANPYQAQHNRLYFSSGKVAAVLIPERYLVEQTEAGYLTEISYYGNPPGGMDVVLSGQTLGAGHTPGPNFTTEALDNLVFILHIDGVANDLAFGLRDGTMQDVTDNYGIGEVPGGQAFYQAVVALNPAPTEMTLTIYDKSDYATTPKTLSTFHEKALQLAARRGTKEMLWGKFGARAADGSYSAVVLDAADLAALQAEAGTWDFILVNADSEALAD